MIAERELNQKPAASTEMRSMAQLFRSRLATDGQRAAAHVKKGGAWTSVSWRELNDRAEELAWGLVAVGVKAGEMVNLVAGTRIEWTQSDLAVMFVGAVAVPIYHSNTPDEIQFIIDN